LHDRRSFAGETGSDGPTQRGAVRTQQQKLGSPDGNDDAARKHEAEQPPPSMAAAARRDRRRGHSGAKLKGPD